MSVEPVEPVQSDAPPPTSPATEPAPREPVSVLPWNYKGLAWPQVFFPSLWWLWRRSRNQRNEKPYSGPLPRKDSGRLSVFAPTRQLSSVIETFDDAPFEPSVFRCAGDTPFGELNEQGLPKLANTKSKGSHFKIAATNTYSTRSLALTHLASHALAFAAVFVLLRVTTGSWWRDGSFPLFLIALALAAVIAAFAKPLYLRISPGAIDILIYPPLGLGRPTCERYNLRTASVAVDDRAGWIGVFDASRHHRQAVFIRGSEVLTRKDVGALILNAARSSHPTPPLPTDELLG